MIITMIVTIISNIKHSKSNDNKHNNNDDDNK